MNSIARRLPVPKSHASEARALLAWMHDGHFVFLGYRYYRLKRGRSRDALVRDGASGLGILRVDASRKTAAHRAHRAICAARRARPNCWCSPRPTRRPPCIAEATSTTSA